MTRDDGPLRTALHTSGLHPYRRRHHPAPEKAATPRTDGPPRTALHANGLRPYRRRHHPDPEEAATTRANGPMRAALHASGLRPYWRRHYPDLREAPAMAAAEAHLLGTLRTLPLTQRAGYAAVLRALPLAYWLTTGGRSLRRPADGAGDGRPGLGTLAALPGFREVVRSSTALALLGALDGRSGQEVAR
ncbi:hypothetical protein JHN63_45370 [Streptomyces sp. MBT65]|uniref:hypothetical protein n=1 Tax=Streptomyces sp. MBT65 TaxID=1488395 RepID=UPI00190D6EFF|nr:hypothetical protein [Streptomyces sp. MBT65]MBK3580888.1 hypothetical protein [Streptomyces sp. MBT65]